MEKSIGLICEKVEYAIQTIKHGGVVVITDDDNRENEGDFIAAAEFMTPELVNFFVKEARGLLCVSLLEKRSKELGLNLMVSNNTSCNKTQFTVSVDLLGDDVSTGISASDRSKTIQALVDSDTKPGDLGRPGHIFPLVAHGAGLTKRKGHTEAAVLLPHLAGLKPLGALIEVMNEDGSMARYNDLILISKRLNLPLITIEEILVYLKEKKISGII